MSFITQRPLFANKVTFLWKGLIFELLLILGLWVFFTITLPQLMGFGSGHATVVAVPDGIALLGLMGIYGFRISTFVAMIRRNRMPQVVEWWCTLIGLAMLIAWPLDGILLRSYASLHGYEFCHELPGGKVTHDLFVLHGHPCPG